MTKLKSKFNRVAADNSQLQNFADDVCDILDNGEDGFKEVPTLPEPTVADAGKALVVNDEGEFALGEGGGTQLYEHVFTLSFNGPSRKVHIISKTSTAYTNVSDVVADNDKSNIVVAKIGDGGLVQIGLGYGHSGELGVFYLEYHGTPGSETLSTAIYASSDDASISDTVTAL